jgi:hypothetical protein
MVRDGAAQDDRIAGTGLVARDVHVVGNHPDPGGVDEDLIHRAFRHDLGVAGDHRDPRTFGRLAHRGDNRFQLLYRKALLDDERYTQVLRGGPAHGQIVHGAVDGEFPDVAAREENRVHGVRVRGERHPLAVQLEDGAVVQLSQDWVVEHRQQHVPGHPVGHLAPAAVV